MAAPQPPIDLSGILRGAVALGASDLHLTSEAPPSVRVSGSVRALLSDDGLSDLPPLSPTSSRTLVYGILTDKQRKRLEEDLELDFSYTVPNLCRFRVNVYVQKNSLGAVFRVIPEKIVPIRELGLPKVVTELSERPRGLVLVTGPTGSGKSTTLASMVDHINRTRRGHIMSVEDPIEFLHRHKGCLVNQREVGADTRSFANALKHVLRQDPDVILVGEMRDLETIQLAITAAETGHMVLATLHTQDAPQSVDRIIDVFPPHQQQQVRTQLANALEGVVTQTLVKKREDRGGGRVVAAEVMVATSGVRNMIREGKNHQIHSAMQTGAGAGMATLDASLVDLVRRGEVSREVAMAATSNPDEILRMLGHKKRR